MTSPVRFILPATSVVLAMMMIIGSTMGADAAELLMFETKGCPWCAAWNREVGPGYSKSTEGHRAPLRRLDVADAAKENIAFASPLNVSPTFVVVEKGREVGRITGYPGADFFWGLLDLIVAKLDRLGDASVAAQ